MYSECINTCVMCDVLSYADLHDQTSLTVHDSVITPSIVNINNSSHEFIKTIGINTGYAKSVSIGYANCEFLELQCGASTGCIYSPFCSNCAFSFTDSTIHRFQGNALFYMGFGSSSGDLSSNSEIVISNVSITNCNAALSVFYGYSVSIPVSLEEVKPYYNNGSILFISYMYSDLTVLKSTFISNLCSLGCVSVEGTYTGDITFKGKYCIYFTVQTLLQQIDLKLIYIYSVYLSQNLF